MKQKDILVVLLLTVLLTKSFGDLITYDFSFAIGSSSEPTEFYGSFTYDSETPASLSGEYLSSYGDAIMDFEMYDKDANLVFDFQSSTSSEIDIYNDYDNGWMLFDCFALDINTNGQSVNMDFANWVPYGEPSHLLDDLFTSTNLPTGDEPMVHNISMGLSNLGGAGQMSYNGTDYVLKNLELIPPASIPEPSSTSLLVLGLLGILGFTRRKKIEYKPK